MKKPSKILYFGKKVLAFLLSVFVLSLAVFYVSRLAPGDPLVSYYGDRAEKLTPQERAQAEEKLGLDEPIFPQYVRWTQNALRGDFGISYKYKMPAGRGHREPRGQHTPSRRRRLCAHFHALAAARDALRAAGGNAFRPRGLQARHDHELHSGILAVAAAHSDLRHRAARAAELRGLLHRAAK